MIEIHPVGDPKTLMRANWRSLRGKILAENMFGQKYKNDRDASPKNQRFEEIQWHLYKMFDFSTRNFKKKIEESHAPNFERDQ